MSVTTVIYPGAILELQFILTKLNSKKIFLVTGKKSYELCGAKVKIDEIVPNQNIIHFNDFNVNPDSKDVRRGIQLLKENDCDLIISVGGGSAIDMAKLINYYHSLEGDDEIIESTIKNEAPSLLKHICIPTTAGSGSEATHFAVMYIGDTKYSVAHQELIPNYTIVDPEFHYSQTPYQKTVSGVDALAQSIESFWSLQSTEESRTYSEKALRLVWENLPKAVHQGDHSAHLNLAVGAYLAGKAINIAKTTAAHALAYGFTKKLRIPHGHAVSISIPFFIEVHSVDSQENPNSSRHLIEAMNVIKEVANVDNKELAAAFESFFTDLGLTLDYNELNITREIFNEIVDQVNHQRLKNNPLKVSPEMLLKLFEYNTNNKRN